MTTSTVDMGAVAPRDRLGRQHLLTKLDQRSINRGSDGSIGFKGHAAVFEQRTWIGSPHRGFYEQVGRTAFDKTLNEADVRFLWNHNPDMPLARTIGGTLRLGTDETGLTVDADLAPTTHGNDLAILLERGIVNQMSFAFEPVNEDVSTIDSGDELRTLQEVRLWDVSAVTYPAYTSAEGGLRAAAFNMLCRSLDLSDDERDGLLRGADLGEFPAQLLPTLQAARSALAGEAGTPPEVEEPQPTRTVTEHDRTRAFRDRQLKMELQR